MKVAIIVGHNAKLSGHDALGSIIPSEYVFNGAIAEAMVGISKNIPTLEIKVFRRVYLGSYGAEIKKVYKEVDDFGADISIELHFNAYSAKSNGTETLSSGSKKSLALAHFFQSSMLSELGLVDRGVKVRSRSELGGGALHAGRAPAILVEPFFGSNLKDTQAAERLGINGFAGMYLAAIVSYGLESGLINESDIKGDTQEPSNPAPPAVGVVPNTVLEFDSSQTKEEFLERNKLEIEAIIESINDSQKGDVPLTLHDVFLLFYSEAAIRENGKIDVNGSHSEGEKGLLPLPESLEFWTGIRLGEMTPQENFEAFLHYLRALKNSKLDRSDSDGNPLYGGLFDSTQSDIEQARILAGVVHGYMYAPNFRLTLPFHAIAESCADGDFAELLPELGYKHGKELLRNRASNLAIAENLLLEIA